MRRIIVALALAAVAVTSAPVAFAKSSGKNAQDKMTAKLPRCTKKLGTIAIVAPDNQWWREFNLGSPEAVIKGLVQESGCFTIVNRDRSLASRNMERALADNGELQSGSGMGKGQVKAADFFLQPDLVTTNRNSGGTSIGLGGLTSGIFKGIGGLAGAINIKKKEASVSLSLVNARTTEEEAVTQGYYRKTNTSLGLGGGALFSNTLVAAGAGGYQNTEIGQVIVLAYVDAYTKMVRQIAGPDVIVAAK